MKNEQLEAIQTTLVGLFNKLSDDQLHEMTVAPYMEMRHSLLAPAAA